jgi:LmbE family N-acetylglucosaminyl deacetylase
LRFTVFKSGNLKFETGCCFLPDPDRRSSLKTVLAVFAHPDDAELTCFGTLGLLKSRGYRVLVGIVTDGLAGTADATASNRVLEAERASAVMGFELLRGALPDGDLQYSSQLIRQVEEWVREYDPGIVITHDYDPAGIDHQDHIAVARAVLNVAHRKPEIELLLQVEPSRGSRSFEPNAFIDVGQFALQKLAAIACHESQSHKDYLQPVYINLRSSWWAAVSGMSDSSGAGGGAHVEAFRVARCSIFASSALAFAKPADSTDRAKPSDRVRLVYPPARTVANSYY